MEQSHPDGWAGTPGLGWRELVLRGTGSSLMGRSGILGVAGHGPGRVAPLDEVQRAQPGSRRDLQHDKICTKIAAD